MKIQFLIVLTSFVCLLYGTCHCFRIRRRSADISGLEDPFALSNAFQSLDNQRRMVSVDEGLGNILVSNDGHYLKQPYDTDDIMDYLTSSNRLDRFIESDYNLPIYERQQDWGGDNKEVFPYLGPYNNANFVQEQKRTFRAPYRPQRVKPSMSELDDVLGIPNAPAPTKRLAPIRRRGPFIQPMASDIESLSLLDRNEKLSDVDPQFDDNVGLIQKMKELLQKVEDKDKTILSKDESEPDKSKQSETVKEIIKVKTEEFPLKSTGKEDSTVEATKEELDDILGRTNESEDKTVIPLKVVEERKEEIFKQTSNNDLIPVEEKVETVVKEVEGSSDSRISKAKRGVNKGFGKTELNVNELLSTISSLKNEVSRLRLLQALEDKENDYLASALQQATLEQLENKENYLKDEYDDINRATETEELIQTLLQREQPDETALNGPEEDDRISVLPDEYLEPSTADEEDKRSERPSLADIADSREKIQKWYEEPVKEDVQGAELEQSPGNEQVEDVPDHGLPDEVDTGGNYIAEENNSPALINSVIAGLRPEEIANFASVYQRHDTCPVEKLSTNCAFADKLHLPIDADARILCNRHEMCYTCGQTIGLTESSCDKGYEGEIIEACRNVESCLKDALLFLGLMKESHIYKTHVRGICTAPCIQDYIYGLL